MGRGTRRRASVRLALAARDGRVDRVQRLLKREAADPRFRGNAAVRWACVHGHAEVVRVLLRDKRVDPGANQQQCLRSAVAGGFAGVVRELLDDPRVDAATGEDTPLVAASSSGCCEIVGLLLRAEGVDPARHESLALCVAAREGQSAVVRELLRDGRVVPSARESAALRWACSGGHAETVGELLKEGSSDPLGGGCSCLNIACGRGHCAVIAKLLGHYSGGHLERLGNVQEALWIACAHESGDVLELLLATGRVDVADNNNAALELAARLERHALATRLLRDPRVHAVGLRDCPLAQRLLARLELERDRCLRAGAMWCHFVRSRTGGLSIELAVKILALAFADELVIVRTQRDLTQAAEQLLHDRLAARPNRAMGRAGGKRIHLY